jgi:hypothetical protein
MEDTLFVIRCRKKSGTEKSEILRVEKTFDAVMDLGANLAGIPGMETFLTSFFDAFPNEKSDQRKVCPFPFVLMVGYRLLFPSHSWITIG